MGTHLATELEINLRSDIGLEKYNDAIWIGHDRNALADAAAHRGCICLYAIILCLPILGWLTLSAEGKPTPFFGLPLPPLLAVNLPLLPSKYVQSK